MKILRKINILLYLIAFFTFILNVFILLYMTLFHNNENIIDYPKTDLVMEYTSYFMILNLSIAFSISVIVAFIKHKKHLIDYWNSND